MISDKKQIVIENGNELSSSDSEFRFNEVKSELVYRLKKLQKNESNVAFSKRCEISESGYRQIIKGQTPNLDTLSKIARANGVKISWLVGESPIDTTNGVDDGVATFEYTPDKPLFIHPDSIKKPEPATDTLYIESFPEVRAAAGTGQISPTDQTVVQLKVNSADWRRYVGLDHKHVKVITVYGDSMHPTLSHGDQVMVDTACSSFIDDAIYCIQQGENLRFKRIKLNLDGSIIVKSDNEKEGFPPEIYSADEASHFRVIGRVIPLKFGWFEI